MKRAFEYQQEWIGKRIREIMDDRGVKLRSLADRLNTLSLERYGTKFGSHQTLHRCLHGYLEKGTNERTWRRLTIRELSLITDCLDITPDRFLQKDTEEDRKRIEEILSYLHIEQNKREALAIGHRLVQVAIGKSERCEGLYALGRVQYNLAMYEDALVTFHEALSISPNTELTYQIYDRIALSYLYSGKLLEHKLTLEKAKQNLVHKPYYLGRFYLFQGYHALSHSQKTEGRKFLYQAYIYLKKVKDDGANGQLNFGRVCNNLAEMRYEHRQYRSALLFFLEAEKNALVDNIEYQLLVAKRIIQCYTALGMHEEAIRLLEKHIQSGKPFTSKYGEPGSALLRAHLTNDMDVAELVLKKPGLDELLYAYAKGILYNINLKKQGDSTNAGHFRSVLMYFFMQI